MSWITIAFISALLSAGAAILQKKILFRMEVLDFSLLASLLTLIVSLPFAFVIRFEDISAISLAVLSIKSFLGAFAFYYVMKSIKSLELSSALPLMALTPGLVAFFAFLILGENLSDTELAGLILLATGTYLLELRDKMHPAEPFLVFLRSKSHHYVLLALLLFTFTSILDKVILKNYRMQPEAFMLFQQAFFFVIFLVISFLEKKRTDRKIGLNLFLLVLFVAIFTAGYRYSQILAVKEAPVALVLAIKRTSVLFAVIVGGRIFKEHSLTKKSIATAIIILGAMMIMEE